MSNGSGSHLEPVEEGDLDLESKFRGARPERKQPEGEPEKIEREVPKEVGRAESDKTYTRILSKVQAQKQPQDDKPQEEVKSDAETVYKNTDAQSQIQKLVDIATTKGVIHSVKVAKHLEDNYVLDMFHDKLLAGELHDALVGRGLIKEI